MMIFGHYVSRRFLILSGLEGALFLIALRLLDALPHCRTCYVGALINLEMYQAVLLSGVFMLIMTSVGVYNQDAAEDFRVFLKRFALSFQLIFLSSVMFFALTKPAIGLSFGWYVGALSLAITLFMLMLFGLHVLLVWWLGQPFMKKRLLVLGDGRCAQAVVEYLDGPGRGRFHMVRTISNWGSSEHVAPRMGNVILAVARSESVPLSRLAEMLHADKIVVCVDDKRGLPVVELLECKLNGIEVVDALSFWEQEAGLIDPSLASAGWLTFQSGCVCNHRRRFLKRGIDIAISLAFLAAVLPMLLIVCLAIKLDSRGPLIYRQERVGLNGRPFQLWKFRSMRTDAEKDGQPRWANTVDDRVTRVGRFIRKVRIDEIPQIVNVLAGDMSFIGPRPERPFFVDQLRDAIPHYDLRHRVRPGITGWAQINYPYGASIEDARRKLSYDLYYLKKNDVLLDFAILLQTVRVVLFAHGSR